jgi:hypothetical protein
MQASSQVLRCHIESSDQTLSLELRPSQDVYDVRSLDFENGFRLGVVITAGVALAAALVGWWTR